MPNELIVNKIAETVREAFKAQFAEVYFWDNADQNLFDAGEREWAEYQGGVKLADNFDMGKVAAAVLEVLRPMIWQDIGNAQLVEDSRILACDSERRVGEAVCVSQWGWSDEAEDTVEHLQWWWANDSCSCCWAKPDNYLTHFMPLPDPPTLQTGER